MVVAEMSPLAAVTITAWGVFPGWQSNWESFQTPAQAVVNQVPWLTAALVKFSTGLLALNTMVADGMTLLFASITVAAIGCTAPKVREADAGVI